MHKQGGFGDFRFIKPNLLVWRIMEAVFMKRNTLARWKFLSVFGPYSNAAFGVHPSGISYTWRDNYSVFSRTFFWLIQEQTSIKE